ncbi:MAG: hypothetical protein WA919_24930 [Coleofasciculaceae cyanobacterium]
MRTSLKRGLMGCMLTLLLVGSLSPVVLAVEIAQNPPAVECSHQRGQVTESIARTWLERSRQYTNYGNLEPAAQTLLRTLELMQRLPNGSLKANLVSSITELEYQSSTLQELVNRAVSNKQPDIALSVLPSALQTAQSLSSGYSWVKTQALVAIANHYITLGQPQQGTKVLSQALQASNYLQGEEFKTKALTAIAQGYQTIGESAKAVELLDQSLQFAQVAKVPNAVRKAWIFQPIAITYAKAGAFDKALQVARLIPTEPQLAYYKDEAIGEIANQYAASGQLERALELLKTLKMGETKAKFLTQIAIFYTQAGQNKLAQDTFNQAVFVAQDEPIERRSWILSRIIKQYAFAGQLDAALSTIDVIPARQTKAQTLLDIAGQVKDKERASAIINKALLAAEEIADANERESLMTQAIDDLLRTKQFASALKIAQSLSENVGDKYVILARIALQAAAAQEFEIALQATDSLPESWVDSRNQALQEMAIAYAKIGKYDQAMQLVQKIDNYGSLPYQVRTLTEIAQQAAAKGDKTRADNLIKQALQIANQLEFNSQKTDALVAIAIFYTKIGQTKQAEELHAQAMQLAKSEPNDSGSTFLLPSMFKQYLDANLYEKAIQTALAITDAAGQRNRALNEIATHLIEAEQFDMALKATNVLSQPEDKTRFLLELVNNYIARGQLTKASEILVRALEVTKTIKGPESRKILVREDLEVDDPFDRGSFLEEIALKYTDIGQYNQGVQVAQRLETKSDRELLLQRLTCYR